MLQIPATLKQLRRSLLDELRGPFGDNEAASISALLLDHVGYPRSLCLAEPDMIAETEAILQIKKILADLHKGAPIQYILGYTDFHDLSIIVNSSVLIPRPETEELVHHAASSCAGEAKEGLRIMDLCSGSGVIALAMKHYFPDAEVYGLEMSLSALELARQNAGINELEVHFEHADLLELGAAEKPAGSDDPFDTTGTGKAVGPRSPRSPRPRKYNLIISNPPYVRESEKALMEDRVLEHEPHLALFVQDEDPLIFYRAIAAYCKGHLEKDGQLWVEINEALGDQTRKLFLQEGFTSAEVLQDIHGKDRFIHARP